MTAQTPETLYYMGEQLSMCSEPLAQYFTLSGKGIPLNSDCTALWRGYVGTWEIVDERLYLIGLNGTTENDEPLSVATLFPDFPDRVFAHWFNGRLRVPQGGLVKYVHAAYSSQYERDLFLDIEHGVVMATSVQHNGIAETNAPRGYGIGAMTIIGKHKGTPKETR
jgi:hypothetical protein